MNEAKKAYHEAKGDHVALAALERVRAMAEANGYVRVGKPKIHQPMTLPKPDDGGQIVTPGPGWGDVGSGPRPSWRDPQPLSSTFAALTRAHGWSRQLAVAKLRGQWAEIVGPTVASHASLESFEDGVLTIETDSASWAVNLQNLVGHIEKTIADVIGEGIVDKVVIRSVQKVSWKKGPLSVPGRGVRDTYD